MDALSNLKSEKIKLEQKLAKINALIAAHERLVAEARAVLGDAIPPNGDEDHRRPYMRSRRDISDLSGEASERIDSDGRRSVSESVREFESIVTRVLQDATHPMNRHLLLEAVTLAGHKVPGTDPLNTLGARMSRMPGVENVPHPSGRGYWLTSRLHELKDGIFD